MKILIVTTPCYGMGDFIFAAKFANQIQAWRTDAEITIATTIPESMIKIITNYKKTFNVIRIGSGSSTMKQCRKFKYLKFRNMDDTKDLVIPKFDLIFAAPTTVDMDDTVRDISNMIPYATKDNTYFVTEYNNVNAKHADFKMGVGEGRYGMLIEKRVPIPKPTCIHGDFCVAYISSSKDYVTCISKFIEMISVKYTNAIDIVLPTSIQLSESTLKRIIKGRGIRVVHKGSQQQVTHGDHMLTLRYDIFPVSHPEMMSLLKYSVRDILLTGDQSISDCLSCCPRKNIFYQFSEWKKSFAQELATHLPNKWLSSTKTSCGTLRAIHINSDSRKFVQRWSFAKLGKKKMVRILHKMPHTFKMPRRSRSISVPKSNPVNRYFDKALVINLYDKVKRWRKVNAQLKKLHIKAKRFIAIDGRAPNQKDADKKLKEFSKEFGVTFKKQVPKEGRAPAVITARETSAAASLTLGTLEILRNMVRNNTKRVLIMEDDVNFDKNFNSLFVKYLRQINTLPEYDMWYFGCGDKCGSRGISVRKNKVARYVSPYVAIEYYDKLFSAHPDDLRIECSAVQCKRLTRNITRPKKAGGTWAYAYSLRGAKKLLAYVKTYTDRDMPLPTPHIDQLVQLAIKHNTRKRDKFVIYSCDPPIIWHEGGAFRKDSDIPWEM